MKKRNQNNVEIDDNKLLEGILLALLDEKPRENKVKILKEVGFNQNEIVNICGPANSTLRVRKLRENKKDGKKK